jgi:hypothetical protein
MLTPMYNNSNLNTDNCLMLNWLVLAHHLLNKGRLKAQVSSIIQIWQDWLGRGKATGGQQKNWMGYCTSDDRL